MANTKMPSKCQYAGCPKRPTYGIPGSKKREFCSQHAKKGMINVNNKRCIQPNCTTIPSFAVVGSKKAEFCSQHAMDGMIDVRSKRRSVQQRVGGAGIQPRRGTGGTRTPTGLPSEQHHASGGAGGPRGKKCGRRGGTLRPSGSVSGAETAEFCDQQHAADGRILVGGVLKGLGGYRAGGGIGSKAGNKAGAFDDQRYGGGGGGDALAAGTKRKQPSLPTQTQPQPQPPLSYPLTTPEYLQGSTMADLEAAARSVKRAAPSGSGAGASGAAAVLPPPPLLQQFRPPSSERFPTGESLLSFQQFRPQPPNPQSGDRYLGVDTAALSMAPSLMQQFRAPSGTTATSAPDGGFNLGGDGFRPQLSERYLGGTASPLQLPDASAYPEDITSVFDRDDVKL